MTNPDNEDQLEQRRLTKTILDEFDKAFIAGRPNAKATERPSAQYSWTQSGVMRRLDEWVRRLEGWPFVPPDRRAVALIALLARRTIENPTDTNNFHAICTLLAKASNVPQSAWTDAAGPIYRQRAIERYRCGLEIYHDSTNELIPGLILEGQPCIVGAAQKGMKTLLSIDLAAALVTGTPFLGMDVPEPVRVAAITLEKPPADWMNSFCRAVEVRGHESDAAMKSILVTSSMDLLRKKNARTEFERYLMISKTGVVITDPLYLIQPPTAVADISAQGRTLRRLVRPIIEAEATPIILHHTLKSAPIGEMPSLSDLSGAGVGPFARSWLLLSRESEYAGGKVHNLLALSGTSTGHCSRHRIRFDEEAWSIT